MIMLLLFILCLIAFIYIYLLQRISKKKADSKFNKNNLYNWMNLTKKQRFDLSKKDSISYLTRRKDLLNQIRNEYKNIPKQNK